MIIDHRDYYNHGGIEAIDAIESACAGFRAARGSSPEPASSTCSAGAGRAQALADLKKARYYLDRLIAEEEKRLGVAEEHAAAMPPHFEQDRQAMAEDTK